MAVDLSIQVFSYEVFNTLFIDHGIVSGDACAEAISDTVYCGYKGEMHCNKDIIHAVYCRQAIFHDVYRLQFEYTDMVHCDGPSDLLAYMCTTFSSHEFKELKVFEHIFATCAFVVEMCLNCFYKNNISFLGDAFLCWAMYFDTELKSDFYKQGGWNVLKCVARSYIPPFLVIKNCMYYERMYHHRSLSHTVSLRKLSAGVEDFYNFQTFSDAGENLTRAKTWVDFRLNNKKPKNSIHSKFDIKTIEGLEDFFRCFKFLCDPLGETVLDSDASIHEENMFSKFPVNKYLPKHMNIFDCNTNSFQNPITSFTTVQEPIDLSNTMHNLTDAVHALTLEIQAMKPKHALNSGTPIGNKNQTNSNDFNAGVLSVYDSLKDSLDVDDLRTAMFHASVFVRDIHRHERAIKANVPLEQIRQARKNPQIVHNETSQSTKPITSHKISDGKKIKKKKKRTNVGDENVSVAVHSNNNTDNASGNNVYSDGTKDILRMVLVLGCQPGYNYVRSTLKNS